MQITAIGLDIAKNVFQVHGIDGDEKVVVRKQLRRGTASSSERVCVQMTCQCSLATGRMTDAGAAGDDVADNT